MKTKILLALLALGVSAALIVSGCSSSGDAVKDPNPYDPANPLTWVVFGDITEVSVNTGGARVFTVNLTNRHDVPLNTDVLTASPYPTVTLTVQGVSEANTQLSITGDINQNETKSLSIWYEANADLEAAIANVPVPGETPATITTAAIKLGETARLRAINGATRITQVARTE